MSPVLDRAPVLDDPSLRGRRFVEAYTDLIDRWIVEIFRETFGDPRGVALIATGGHGRHELAPQSDLDLLLLHDGSILDGTAQRLWSPMWDAKLKVGHATRSLPETLALASDDLATATSLLTSRLLAGDADLCAELVEASATQWRKQSKRSLAQLADAVDSRHVQTGEVAAALEPDLKEGRGGLRDVHALAWIHAAQPELAILAPSDLTAEYDTLLDARVELHRITRRPGDVLHLHDQDEVAARLGIENADVLMTNVATAARRIAWASDEAFFEVRQSLNGGIFKRSPRRRDLGGGVELVSERVNLVGAVEGDGAATFVPDPVDVLRVAVAAATHRARIGRATLEALGRAPALPEPWPAEARELFVDLLRAGPPAIGIIETLDLSDLWLPLVPEWEPNRSRPQRNAYHRYNVDRHSWECVALAAGLTDRVDRPDLLVMGALLHDVGKGYPGEHSIVGKELGASVMRRMGFPETDIDTVTMMIEHHLLLPDVATRRDLDDPATILSVVARVGTAQRLHLLEALAEADSIATGPSAWSPWKAGLLEKLVERADYVTRGGDVAEVIGASEATAAQLSLVERGATGDRPAIDAHDDRLTIVFRDRPGLFSRIAGVLALNGLDVLEASVWTDGDLAIEEFRVVSAFGTEIAWSKVERDLERALLKRIALEPRLAERARSYQRRRTTARSLEPRVRVLENEASDGATVVEVVGPDRVGLLYALTRALADLDLDILRAKIATMGNDVVDSFYVRDRSGAPITDEADGAEIRTALLHVLRAPSS
ncbi:MAG: [protein-PII] uridylyltransferase [Acidimicrobiales bacterium]